MILLVLLAGVFFVVGAGLAAEAPGSVTLLAVHQDLLFVGLCILHSAPRSQTLQEIRLLQTILHKLVQLFLSEEFLQVGQRDLCSVTEEAIDFELLRQDLRQNVLLKAISVGFAPTVQPQKVRHGHLGATLVALFLLFLRLLLIF